MGEKEKWGKKEGRKGWEEITGRKKGEGRNEEG